MKKLVVFGTGDFARVAKVYLEVDGGYEVAAFTAHEKYIAATEMLGCPIVPFEQLARQYPPDEYAMFAAIGFSRLNRARAEVYDAAKAAVIGLTHTLSRSLGPDGIRVNVVAPGSIYTEKVREVFNTEFLELQRNRIPIRTHVGPQDVANALGFFLSPASDAVSGELLRVSGGLR